MPILQEGFMDITITPDQMKTLETQYMREFSVPGALLMEHAAQGICAALKRRVPFGRVLFLCGPGNNGGDGYAAARLWQASGAQAIIAELSDSARGDALMNRTLARQAGIPIHTLPDLASLLPSCDAVVDALFGTGLSKPVEGAAAQWIRLTKASGKPVIAVDIPSGLCGRTGAVLGCALPAAETVTFHRMKPGLLLGSGPRYAGDITLQPILIPKEYGLQDGLRCLSPEDLSALIPPRPIDGHKGTFGKALIFAGSPGMAGAAAFAANACIRTGAGLTTLLCTQDILPTLQMLAPGAVCIPLPDPRTQPNLAFKVIRDALHGASAVLIGPGLGQDSALVPLLPHFCLQDTPVVWDADALNLLAVSSYGTLPAQAFITPHPGEAARLLRCTAADITADPLSALHRLHHVTGANVLLKGCRTLMTDGKALAVNRYGTPAMAKGGSGDVLAGILTGLLAQNPHRRPLEALQLAALIHGLAGLRAAAIHGENSVSAQDLIDCIRLDAKG